MAVNAFRPHLVMVPEDDANKALAIEFFLKLPDMPVRAYQVEPVAGGWVPDGLQDRVFVLGVWSEPEALQSARGHAKLSTIAHALARECDEGGTLWQHGLLAHNAAEASRLRPLLARLRC